MRSSYEVNALSGYLGWIERVNKIICWCWDLCLSHLTGGIKTFGELQWLLVMIFVLVSASWIVRSGNDDKKVYLGECRCDVYDRCLKIFYVIFIIYWRGLGRLVGEEPEVRLMERKKATEEWRMELEPKRESVALRWEREHEPVEKKSKMETWLVMRLVRILELERELR
nr:hypothetical protein CFP56_30384 [Quercus suber]